MFWFFIVFSLFALVFVFSLVFHWFFIGFFHWFFIGFFIGFFHWFFIGFSLFALVFVFELVIWVFLELSILAIGGQIKDLCNVPLLASVGYLEFSVDIFC